MGRAGGWSAWSAAVALVAVLATVLPNARATAARAEPPESGFAFMDVTDRAAVFWTRARVEGRVEVDLVAPDGARRTTPIDVDAARDFVATAKIRGLQPATTYGVEVRLPTARDRKSVV